ncbi:MAG: WG repeat-containing protein [Bacteroidales bacterium]|nr:WG repeat-containing protein [Bacteroidales bacterium]
MKEKLIIILLILSVAIPVGLISQQYVSVATFKGKSGFINEKGNWQIEPEYDEVTGFVFGLAAVRVEDSWGYIDHNGTYIISSDFDRAGPFMENGFARIEIDGTTYYMDVRGNRIPESEAIVFNEELALIQYCGKYGYIGRDFQWKIPPVFDKAWPFRDGNARVKRNNKWYYINSLGYEEYIPSRSRSYQLNGQQQEFIKRKGKEKWGFAGLNDVWVIPPVFDYVKSFSEGLAPVRIGNNWGYIDDTGELVIDTHFEDAFLFKNGLASVKTKGLYGCIDTFGNQVIKSRFENPLYFFPLEEFTAENEIFNRDEPCVILMANIDLPEIQVDRDKVYAPEDKRLALVIGNSNYQSGDHLKNTENDATEMADALRNLGFVVNIFLNTTQLTMKQAVDAFGEQLKDYDVGLFFYAGHGIQADGYNYLVPVDAVIQSERDVEYTCVEAGRVLSRMEDSGNKTNIVIFDACRDNPFERSWTKNSNGQGLAFMRAPPGSLIAYATAPGTTASDGFGENGLYTSSLLSHLATPGFSILEIFQKVRTDVRKISSDQQVPWESTSLEGNFYFIK